MDVKSLLAELADYRRQLADLKRDVIELLVIKRRLENELKVKKYSKR